MLLPAGPRNWLGDKGYIGSNMLTSFRKPEGGELLYWQKEFNEQIYKIMGQEPVVRAAGAPDRTRPPARLRG